MSTARPLPPRIRRQALEWLVTMWSGEATATEHQALQRWRAAHAEHERAWQHVQSLGRAMQDVPSALSTPLRNPPRNRRRDVLRCLAALAVTGAAGVGATRTDAWLEWNAGMHTARNERRSLQLPDGTQLTLNGGTALDIVFDGSARRLLLRAGEILIETGHESGPYRSFSVITPQGEVRALGTRFTVRRLDGITRVAVFEGAVEISPSNGTASRLATNDAADFDGARLLRRFEADPLQASWSRGLLVADRMRMADFLTELGRYRAGILRCDASATELVVSGVYPLADTDVVLGALAQALPVRVSSIGPWWTSVAKK